METQTNNIVQEIHNAFYTEVDLLLAQAKVSTEPIKPDMALANKITRLRKLGFSQCGEIKQMSELTSRIQNQQKENATKAELVQVIAYFSLKYPHLKFITEDSVVKICSKYNLVYGTIDRYRGTVPDKNLEHIENFKINKEDECYSLKRNSYIFGTEEQCKDYVTQNSMSHVGYMPMPSYNNWDIDPRRPFSSQTRERLEEQYALQRRPYDEVVKCPFEICAPHTDFDMTDMKVVNNQIVPKDPIVLQPVVYKNKKYYLIVTAWGAEAADELVVNHNHN